MYPNGEVPTGLLVARPCAGKDVCLMMPGTAAKHDRLVALAQAERGWTPVVSGPSDGYRTRGMQQTYWDTMPYPQAAYPGTSSHGGTYNGVESGAVDYGNYGEVGRAVFFDLARRAGFQPGYFDGTGGRPDEPWHVIDWSPWDVPATPAPTIPAQSEEDIMARLIRNDDGTIFLADEYGTIDPRKLLDPNTGLQETVGALDTALGAKQLSNRQFDLVGMALTNRWTQQRAALIADITKAVVEALGKALPR